MSVERFETYSNVDLPFIPVGAKRKPLPVDPQRFGDTQDVAGWLEPAGRRVEVSERPELSFDYVAREVSILRTTGGAVFDDPGQGGAGNPLGRVGSRAAWPASRPRLGVLP